MKRLILLTAVLIAALALPAGAFTYDESGGAFGPGGSQLVLGSEAVPAAAIGLRCDVTVDFANNDSIRSGSDVTVSSGTDSRLFADTEATVGDPGPVTFQMLMGPTITATLTFSPEGVFSGSGTVTVGACEPPVTPPVTPPDTPPVTPPADTPVTPSPGVVTVSPATAVRTALVATAVVAQPGFTG